MDVMQPEDDVTAPTNARTRVVFLLDVDNTLLDNDRVTADLKRHLFGGSAPSARSATGRSSRSCEPSWATPTTWAPSSATASSARAIPHLLGLSLVPRQLSVRQPAVSRLARRVEHLAALGPDGHPVRRRRRLPAAQGRALRTLRRGRAPGPDLHPQGAGARRRRAALPGRPLRARRRQGPDSDGA